MPTSSTSGNDSSTITNPGPSELAGVPAVDARLRILLLSPRFEVRGSSSYTFRLAAHLNQYQVEASVACTSASAISPSRQAQLSIREYPFLENRLLRRLAVAQMAHGWREAPPDLIHVQHRKMLPVAHLVCHRLQVPYVATIHDLLGSRERLPPSPWARRLIAVSDAVKHHLVTHAHVPEALVVVIPSGVELPDLASHESPASPQGRVPIVGTAGPLEPIKGHPYFLEAAQLVLSSGKDVEFLIAGAGPEEANLRRLTRLLHLAEKVTFVPYVREFTEVLRMLDIFCLPSLQQGLGTVMLEAMALGKPVIASGVGGISSVVHDGETGLLVPRGNATALADAILKLLQDAALAERLGRNARQLVAAQFTVEQMTEKTVALYHEVIRK